MDVAVLLLIFNRPNHTDRVMKRLSEIKPTRLYIAADGPRKTSEQDKLLCKEARKIASKISWNCDLQTLFRDDNLGCKHAVSDAINWFFDHEPEGIILEDDCIPHPDFFRFCLHGMERYRHDFRVYAITGDNFQDGLLRAANGASYYFSKYPHCWGWASWRRAWVAYDGELTFWKQLINSDLWNAIHYDLIERSHWEKIGHQVLSGELDSWAIPWMFSVWNKNGLTMTPEVNLVNNIGFGADATHTTHQRHKIIKLQCSGIGNIIDTPDIISQSVADRYTFLNHFGGNNLMFPRSLLVQAKKVLAQLRQLIYYHGN